MRELRKGLKRILSLLMVIVLMLNANVAGMVAKAEEDEQVTDDGGESGVQQTGVKEAEAVQMIENMNNHRVVVVCLGNAAHNGAITENGDLYCWGFNDFGQIGNGTNIYQAKPVKVLENVVSFAAYDDNSAAITENGDLYCWGSNYYGQVGDGNRVTSGGGQKTPAKVLLDNVKAVSLGGTYSAAITENGDLYCWGDNRCGQVGNGTTKNQVKPVKVLENVVFVDVYDSINGVSVAITENGDLYCWGYNENGNVGNGTTINQTRPVKVLENVKYITSKGCTAAITENGDLYCWGYNADGKVGNGTTVKQLTPVKVMESVISVSLGGSHSGAITQNGDLYCWGTNYSGQVGNGTTVKQLIPVKVMENAVSISLGGSHSGAITENGDLYCWGSNCDGEVGDGTMTVKLTPVKVMENVISAFFKGGHSSVIVENGDLYCWGNNDYSNGTNYPDQPTPARIMNLKTGYIYGSFDVKKKGFNEYVYRANYLRNISNLDDTLTMSSPCNLLNTAAKENGLEGTAWAWESLHTLFGALDKPTSLGKATIKGRDMYAAILMNTLESTFSYSLVNKQWEDNAKLCKDLLSNVYSVMQEWERFDIYQIMDFKSLTAEQKEKLSKTVTEWFKKEQPTLYNEGEIFKGITLAFDTVNSFEAYYNRIVSCMTLRNVGEDMKAVLQQALIDSRQTANLDFRLALADCMEIIDSSVTELTLKLMGEGFTTAGANTGKWLFEELIWKDVKNRMYMLCPEAAVLMATYKGVTFGVNTLLSTDKIVERYFYMQVMEDMERVFYATYKNLENNFAVSQNPEDARIYLSAVDLMFNLKNEDCEQAYKYVDILDSAVANKIAHAFGKDDKFKVKESIRGIQNSYKTYYDTISKSWIYELEVDYPDLYEYYDNVYNKTTLKQITKWIETTHTGDVYVYDKTGKLVASSTGEGVSCSGDNVSIIQTENEKSFLFYGNQDYRIEYVGNGAGTADITIKEYNENEEQIRNVNYYDVSLENGVTYEMPVEGENMADTGYTLTDAGASNEINRDYDSKAENTPYKVKVIKGSMTYKNGMFFETDVNVGEEVAIHAYVPEGAEFIRWESTVGENIFKNATSAETSFIMPAEDCEITAIVKKGIPVLNLQGSISKGYDGTDAISIPNDEENGYTSHISEIPEFVYYMDEACTIQTGTEDTLGGAKEAGKAPKKIGTYYVKAAYPELPGCEAAEGTGKLIYHINKGQQMLTGTTSYTKSCEEESFVLDVERVTGDGALSYRVTEGNDVVEVTASGEVVIRKEGTAKICVTAAETPEYEESIFEIEIVISGPKLFTALNTRTVFMGEGKVLSEDAVTFVQGTEGAAITVKFKTTEVGRQDLFTVADENGKYFSFYVEGNKYGFENQGIGNTDKSWNGHGISLNDGNWHTVTLLLKKDIEYRAYIDGKTENDWYWSANTETGVIPTLTGETFIPTMVILGAGQTLNKNKFTGVMKLAKIYNYECDETTIYKDHGIDGDNEEKIIEVTSRTLENSNTVAAITGGGTVAYGETATLTASEAKGYKFIGWFYKDDIEAGDISSVISTDMTYSFVVTSNATEEDSLVALYESKNKVNFAVTDTSNITVNGEAYIDVISKQAGTEITVAYTGDASNFLYWKNTSGKIVSTKAVYTFTLVNNTTLTPVVKSAETGKALVEFVNEYKQVLSVSTWTVDGKDVLSANTPSKLGYVFIGWALETAPTIVVDANVIREQIINETTHIRLLPVYEKAAETRIVTYDNGTGEIQTVEVPLGETYTITTSEVEGKTFHCWKKDDTIISYNKSYTFLVTEDVTITAEFTTESLQAEPLLQMTSQYEIKNGETVEKVAFVASREIPTGYTLLEHGMLYAKNSNLTETDFVEGTEKVNKFTATGTGAKGAFTLNVRIKGVITVQARAYAIIRNDSTGEVIRIYSGLSTYTTGLWEEEGGDV